MKNKETWKIASKRVQRKFTSNLPSESNLCKEIIRFVITVLSALLGTAGMQSCGLI